MEFYIHKNPAGYYTLYVDNAFEGNYDTTAEAALAADQLLRGAYVADFVTAACGERGNA